MVTYDNKCKDETDNMFLYLIYKFRVQKFYEKFTNSPEIGAEIHPTASYEMLKFYKKNE